MLRRREFLSGIAAASLLRGQSGGRKPNILFILADDLGYGDIGCYGQKKIVTPNIDRLATQGVRFTDCYAGSTICAPSRCSLMTGMHSGHGRIRGNEHSPLLASDLTVAQVLQRANYHTGIIGKWGIGDIGTEGMPNLKGFDESYGYIDQTYAHTYYPQIMWNNTTEQVIGPNLGQHHTWSPDLLTEHAISFIDRNRSTPFFLYLAHTLPHANNQLGSDTGNGMEVPNDKPYTDRPWPQVEKNFAAMVTYLDTHVGKVLAQLQKNGLEENTLVFFASDNGPHSEGGHDPKFFSSAGPFRGIKRDLYEGGIRVPMIARWPGKVPVGVTSDFPWAFWDFLPTAAELAGVSPPAGVDGMSVLPTLLGHSQKPHDYLYWESYEKGFQQAVRLGNWKGVRTQAGASPELYDLKHDISEKTNVAAAHPDVVAQMEKIMTAAHVDSPTYSTRGRSDRGRKRAQ
ncbi:MAG TPA: arylsulfatase [Bryobacteraceae bacterium]|nr:arylsulfatase [Bryobacteraceae bacterium]